MVNDQDDTGNVAYADGTQPFDGRTSSLLVKGMDSLLIDRRSLQDAWTDFHAARMTGIDPRSQGDGDRNDQRIPVVLGRASTISSTSRIAVMIISNIEWVGEGPVAGRT